MSTIEIFGFAASTYVRTARMLCEEKRLEYQLKPLEFGQPSHRALHPFLRMPIMRIGELVFYETLAMSSYVDETFSGPRLAPTDAHERARMLQWISVFTDYLYSDLVRAGLKSENLSDDQLAVARRDLEVIDEQVQSGPYLLGKEVRLCDLFLAPMIAYAEQSKLTAGLLAGLDGLTAWRDRMWARRSFQATRP